MFRFMKKEENKTAEVKHNVIVKGYNDNYYFVPYDFHDFHDGIAISKEIAERGYLYLHVLGGDGFIVDANVSLEKLAEHWEWYNRFQDITELF